MLLYNDYIFTLLGRNSLLPIENEKGLEKITGGGTSDVK
jgi:hypothetical protein